jgi:Lar family restriction alleviation protein
MSTTNKDLYGNTFTINNESAVSFRNKEVVMGERLLCPKCKNFLLSWIDTHIEDLTESGVLICGNCGVKYVGIQGYMEAVGAAKASWGVMGLKACPFCRSKHVCILNDCLGSGLVLKVYFSCNDCGACGPTADTTEEAAAQWNSRDVAIGAKEKRMEEAIRSALRIKDLWVPCDKRQNDNDTESLALVKMLNSFLSAIEPMPPAPEGGHDETRTS